MDDTTRAESVSAFDPGLFANELRLWLGSWQAHAIMVVAILLFAFAGTFDSDLIRDGWMRLLMWGPLLGGFYVLYIIACATVAGFTGRSPRKQARLATIILALFVIPAPPIGRTLIGVLAESPIHAVELVRAYAHGMFIATGLGFAGYLAMFRPERRKRLQEKARIAAIDAQEAAHAPQCTLPVPLYIESEDHYVKFVADGHVNVVRGTLREQVEIFDAFGFRCHQSFWVRSDAIVGRRRDGRRLFLQLENGQELPVGRSLEKDVIARLDAAGIKAAI